MPANRQYPSRQYCLGPARERGVCTARRAATACAVAMLVAGTLVEPRGMAAPESTPAATNIASATPATSSGEGLPDQLRDLGETLGRITHAITQLQGDYNQRGPDMDDLMMDPVSSGNPGLLPSELMDGPRLAPQKKWVEYSLTELTKLAGMLNADLLKISQDKFSSDKLKVQVDVLNDTRLELTADLSQLVTLTQNNLNDRAGVLKLCRALRDDTSGMNEIRKRLLRLTKGN